MAEKITRRNFIAGAAGLAYAASGLNLLSGCGKFDPADPFSMPVENPLTGLRPVDVYEGDIKKPMEERITRDGGFIDGVYGFRLQNGFPGQPSLVLERLIGNEDGRAFPFDVDIRQKRSTSGIDGVMILTDNDENFMDGEEFPIMIGGVYWTPLFCGAWLPTESEKIVVRYHHGNTQVTPERAGIEAYFVHPDGTRFSLNEQVNTKDFVVRLDMTPYAQQIYGPPTRVEVVDQAGLPMDNPWINVEKYSTPVAVSGFEGMYDVFGRLSVESGRKSNYDLLVAKFFFDDLVDTQGLPATVNASAEVKI